MVKIELTSQEAKRVLMGLGMHADGDPDPESKSFTNDVWMKVMAALDTEEGM